jgi:hypothetical protein
MKSEKDKLSKMNDSELKLYGESKSKYNVPDNRYEGLPNYVSVLDMG